MVEFPSEFSVYFSDGRQEVHLRLLEACTTTFPFSSKVESWLLQLEQTMKETVRQAIAEAIAAYEEKPRELWILDFPAQVALTGSQIWWTTDVGIAFSRLEEGYETALKDFHKKQVLLVLSDLW